MAWFSKKASGFEFKIKDGQAILMAHEGAEAELVIPAKHQGKTVTTIGANALSNNSNLKSVTLPEGLKGIEHHAFANCINLHTVNFNESLAMIGSDAFNGCSSLESVILPDSLTSLYRSAFENCSSLIDIELGESLEVLNQRAFAGCTSLRSVMLPYVLKRIGKESFEGCTSLNDLYYYSKRGISDVMITDRELRESVLPNEIDYIGPRAFANCSSLTKIMIPYLVREISKECFSGCSSLEKIEIHNLLRSIDDDAFAGCSSLKEIKLPLVCKEISQTAFDNETTIVSSSQAYAASYAAENGHLWRGFVTDLENPSSAMIPRKQGEPHHRYYSDEYLVASEERYEMRSPSYDPVTRPAREHEPEIVPARFSYENGVYISEKTSGPVRIMMVGDLMARARQQAAAFDGENYSYDFSFSFTKDLFAEADLVVGNMEGMVSPSAPYTLEKEHVNARPHLNSSEEYLAAVRRAGFDCVISAQNHVYDTGVRGIFETLDKENEYQLMHTGVFTSPDERRYLLIDIGGVRIALVAYFDGARQLMKKANFTKKGREVMLSMFDSEQIIKDIADARSEGATYVIAYCHWGREYTHALTQRQENFAQEVADAGADYMVGSHSHCLQPYQIVTAEDGRKVPCLYSAGNFISDINIKPPITRDTLVLDISIELDENKQVKLVQEQYHPCRILNLRKEGEQRDYAVLPTNQDLGSALNKELSAAYDRIVEVVGDEIKVAW